MQNKMTPKPVPSQRERFEQAARELGVELDEEKLKEALRNLANSRAPKQPADSKDGGEKGE